MSTRIRTALLLTVAAVVSLGVAQVVRDTSPTDPGPPEVGTSFQSPAVAPQQVPRAAPLAVDSFQVHRVADGSHLGAAGDLLVTFWGRGFLLTAKAPRVLVGELSLESTEINGDGTQLYVLVPRAEADRLQATRFEAVTVVNPGGGQDPELSRVSVPATPGRLLSPGPDAPPARVVYGDGAFRRVLVR